ncbi:hypothetical protein GH714_031088 [Hevea brasiliensis]|uniref:Uncharacterized protein n=1 Tax=Hevea brasiliensis TaxID=3981 RepID=A0A6A6N7K7_HEVBR|nr:hypothetical protein GH714_031088 [Hevea brasiliensis]
MTRAPIRVMFKARDFYVKSMLKFAGSVDDDEEFKKLLRLLSAKGICELETNLHCREGDGDHIARGLVA